MRIAPLSERLQARCNAWNQKHPVGTPVRFYPEIGSLHFRERKTRSTAYVLSGHTAVVFLEGEVGCVALDAVVPAEVPSHA